MRIRVIVPVSMPVWNSETEAICNRLREPGVTFEVVNLPAGPETIENEVSNVAAAVHVVEAVRQAERDGCAGVLVYCFDDPGLEAAREAVSIPVVGAGHSALALAMMLGERPGVITTTADSIPASRRRAARICPAVDFEPLGLPVKGLLDREAVFAAAERAGRALLQRGADVLVAGCAGITGIREELSSRLGVPVVLPAEASVVLIQAVVRLGLAHSKVAFPGPGGVV